MNLKCIVLVLVLPIAGMEIPSSMNTKTSLNLALGCFFCVMLAVALDQLQILTVNTRYQ